MSISYIRQPKLQISRPESRGRPRIASGLRSAVGVTTFVQGMSFEKAAVESIVNIFQK